MIKKLHDSNVNHVTHVNNKVASVDRDGNIALSEVSWNKVYHVYHLNLVMKYMMKDFVIVQSKIVIA